MYLIYNGAQLSIDLTIMLLQVGMELLEFMKSNKRQWLMILVRCN